MNRPRRAGAAQRFSSALLLWVPSIVLPAYAAAQAGPIEPELAVVGGTGLLGGTVGVVIQLSHDVANAAVAADLDIDFRTDLVEFNTPVSAHCRVAARLASTHQVGGTVPQPGLLRVAIFARTLEIDPLGDGELATCGFHILPDAAATTAALTIAFGQLTDHRGDAIPVVGVDGAITIADVAPACAGDCNGDNRTTIDELVRGVRIALGTLPLADCRAMDSSGDGKVAVSELVKAVKQTLVGCQATAATGLYPGEL